MNTEANTEKLVDLLKHFDTAMLVTSGLKPGIHARPMEIAEVEEDGTVWFLTSTDSVKVHEIEQDTAVALILQDGHTCHVSLQGHASLSHNQQKIQDLWKESYKVWFPGGADDPEIELIQIHPDEAEFWDNRGAKGLGFFWKAVKAYATGTKPENTDAAQHGTIAV